MLDERSTYYKCRITTFIIKNRYTPHTKVSSTCVNNFRLPFSS